MKLFDWLFGARKKKDNPVEDGNPALLRAMHQVAVNENPENRRKVDEALLECGISKELGS